MDLKKIGASKETTKIKRKRRLKFGIKQKLLIFFLLDEITTRITDTVFLISTINVDIKGATSAGEENSRAMEGISASSEQQTASMEEITSTANKLGTLAEKLKEGLDMFRLEESKEVRTQVAEVRKVE